MAYNVIMLPAAEEDYREILRYLDRRFDSPQAIRAFNQKLREVGQPDRNPADVCLFGGRNLAPARLSQISDRKLCGAVPN